MTASSPTEYLDSFTRLSVEAPTASRSTLRLRAAGVGVGAVVDLTAAGAAWLAGTLATATADAVAEADFPPADEESDQ